jgi:hypothetical protein
LRRSLKIALTVAAAASAVVVLSCEAIVSDTVPGFNCSGTSLDACPPGQYCKGVGCTACEKVDVCDHYDNDCNGKVDDGPFSDADGDGYSWCGELDATNHPINADCDDTDPNIHPGATEVCDGKDNDCNGKIDDGDNLCGPPPAACIDAKCVANPCDYMDGGITCSNTQHCDSVTHTCVGNTLEDIGFACKADSECKPPYYCADATVLGSNVLPQNATAMCTQDCCSSMDCPPSFVCYSPGSGGHYCVDPTKIGRTGTGNEAAGVSEPTSTRCRSGLSQNGKCIDTCCSNANCTNGTQCGYGKLSGHDTWVCLPNGGQGKDGDLCWNGNSDCSDQLCLGSTFPYCFGNCCTSQAGTTCNGNYACVYGKVTTSSDPIPVCGQPKNGGGGIGATCADASTCASNFCYDDVANQQKYCSDVCCTDADCGGGTFVCRPAPQFLRCVKN